MPAYVIEQVGETWEWTGQYGTNRSYKLNLKGSGPDGTVLAGVELAQKPDTPAPTIGQTLNGTIDTTGRYPKFRKEQQQGGGGGGGWKGSDPKEHAEIRMEWAIREALVYTRLRMDQGKLPEAFTLDDVLKIADKLAEHVMAAPA
jgi:hypothetical protein